MFFKSIDKFFDQFKSVISVIIFTLIALASLFFIYWLVFSANVIMPDWLNNFIWAIIDFFAQNFKGTPLYKDIIPVLPVLTSGVFIILTYFANCALLFLENNHKRFQNTVVNYRINLEKTINEELQKDFKNELKKTSFMVVKIKVAVTKHVSYLTVDDDGIDPVQLGKDIEQAILNAVKSDSIQKKGLSKDSVFFLISDLANSKSFFENLVSVSSNLIGRHISQKMNIGFYCGAEVFKEIEQFDEKSAYLDRVVSLKLSNRIIITPAFKVFFDYILPNYYDYNVMGEYNLSTDPNKTLNVMLHSIKRKG